MGYRCGIGPGMRRIGAEPREPHIVCDGCGRERLVINPNSRNFMPPKWFLVNRAAPGWRMLRVHTEEKRWDLCPKCWKEPEEGKDP